MKKILLTVAIACVSIAMQAQLSATSTHLDSVYYFWNAHKRLTVDYKPTLITFDFSDTTGLNFSKFWTQTDADWNGVYKYAWDATEKALKIDFDYSSKGATDNYSAVLSYDWSNQIKAETSEIFNPFINADDYVEGVFLDLSDQNSRALTIDAKAVDLLDSAEIRFDLSDANGRQTNQWSPKHTISPQSSYSKMTYKWNVSGQSNDWNQDVNVFEDGWSDSFLAVRNGRSYGFSYVNLPPEGLPIIGPGGSDIIKLDTTAICKWNIQINDGRLAYSGVDRKFTVYIKKLQIGDISAEGTENEYVFGGKTSGFQGSQVRLTSISFSQGYLSPSSSLNDSVLTVLLPAGTTTVPTSTFRTNINCKIANYTLATNISDTTTITVMSNICSITKTYKLVYHVMSNDATLSSLLVSNGIMDKVFSSSIYEYNVSLPLGLVAIPSVNAVANNTKAKISVSNATHIPGTTTVTVTAEDGTKKSYTINYYSGNYKQVSFILSRFIVFEDESININACVSVLNSVPFSINSGNSAVATIDNNGFLKGIKYGKTNIYAKNTTNDSILDSASVIVLPNIVIVGATVSSNGTQIEVFINGDFPLYPGIEGDFYVANQLKSDNDYTVMQVMKKVGSPNVLLLQLDKPLDKNNSFTIKYAPVSASNHTATVKSSFVISASGTDVAEEETVKVYPNPAKSIIYVEAKDLKQCKIFDFEGKELISLTETDNSVAIPISDLPDGVYFLQIITIDKTFRKTIIKR